MNPFEYLFMPILIGTFIMLFSVPAMKFLKMSALGMLDDKQKRMLEYEISDRARLAYILLFLFLVLVTWALQVWVLYPYPAAWVLVFLADLLGMLLLYSLMNIRYLKRAKLLPESILRLSIGYGILAGGCIACNLYWFWYIYSQFAHVPQMSEPVT